MYVKDVVVQNQVGLHARLINLNHQFGLKKKNEGLMQKVCLEFFH